MSYALIIEFPSSIKQRLASFCYGLPGVEWMGEYHFYLPVRLLGNLTSIQLLEVIDSLAPLYFHSFTLQLASIKASSLKGKKGALEMGIANIDCLTPLSKEINSLLKTVALPPHTPFAVPLGYFDHPNSAKLHEYLLMHSETFIAPFEVSSCSLVLLKKSAKTFYYEVIRTYSAAPLSLDD